MIKEKHFAVVGPEGLIKHTTSEDDALKAADRKAKGHPGNIYHVLGSITTIVYPIGEAVWDNNFPTQPIKETTSKTSKD